MSEESLSERGSAGGPEELASRLIARRHALGDEALSAWLVGDLNDVQLLQLLMIVHDLSFRRDEGRYPRFTIVVPARREARIIDSAAVRFDRPVAVRAKTLRRLAPAVPPRPHALLLRVIDERLACVGIGRFETAGAMLPEDQTGLYLRAEGLVIEISGPGDITVHEAREIHTTRAGRLTPEFDGNRAIGHLPLLARLRDHLLETSDGDKSDATSIKITAAISDLLMYVLKETVALGHGGGFAVLPTAAESIGDLDPHWRGQIQVAWPTDGPHILTSIGEYAASRWGHSTLARYTALQTLTDAAYTVARLSATDGFVLMNEKLKVIGFGAKAGWEGAVPSNVVEADDRLEPTREIFDLSQAGTRHAAAYRLCRAVPGAHVFLVSQDTDLRFFFSPTAGDVRVTAPLTPVTYLFQGV